VTLDQAGPVTLPKALRQSPGLRWWRGTWFRPTLLAWRWTSGWWVGCSRDRGGPRQPRAGQVERGNPAGSW